MPTKQLVPKSKITTAYIFDKKGKIISVGYNSYTKTHPYQAKLAKIAGLPDKIFLHAEIDAILKCKRIGDAKRILISRIGADGKPLIAKPCKICALAIERFGIKEIEFTL